jgi:hypothetical protein
MGRMGCTSCLVWGPAFVGSQTVTFGSPDAASIDAVDFDAVICEQMESP